MILCAFDVRTFIIHRKENTTDPRFIFNRFAGAFGMIILNGVYLFKIMHFGFDAVWVRFMSFFIQFFISVIWGYFLWMITSNQDKLNDK